MARTEILFVLHNATRTGAPVEMLRFLEWLKKKGGTPFAVLLQEDGELERDFGALAPTRVWRRTRRIPRGRWSRIRARLTAPLRTLGVRIWISRRRVQRVVVNTVFCADALDRFFRRGVPGVCRIHELEYTIRYFRFPRGYVQFQRTLDRCGTLVAVSDAVADNLVGNHGVDSRRIVRIPGGIHPDDGGARDEDVQTCRRLAGIPESAPVVGGCGWVNWIKGPDLFLQLACKVVRLRPGLDARFVWVGGNPEDVRFHRLEYDRERLGLTGRVHLAGQVADPRPWLALFDILALTSREDSYPLVMLEAGLEGTPTIAFQKSGGAREFVDRGGGRAVPYLDVDAMAAAVVEWLEDTRALGHAAILARAAAAAHDVDILGPRLLEAFTGNAAGGKAP